MIGKVVYSYEHQSSQDDTKLTDGILPPLYSATEIASTLCLVVGIIQVNSIQLKLSFVNLCYSFASLLCISFAWASFRPYCQKHWFLDLQLALLCTF